MTLFGEPAGGSTQWIGWEVIYGCPLIVLLAMVAISITLARALRVEKGPLETAEASRAPAARFGFEEVSQEEGKMLFPDKPGSV